MMKKKRKSYIEHLFLFFVVIELLIILLSGIMSYNAEIIVYGNFAIEIAVIAYVITSHKFKLKINRNDGVLLLAFIIVQVFMFIMTSLENNILQTDIHKILMCIGMIYCSYCIVYKEKCSPKLLDNFLKLIIIFGLIATIYNIAINASVLMIGRLNIIMYYTWGFRAFFPARAAYGSFLAICSIVALMKSEQTKNILYLFIYIWFAGNTIITSARAQCLALIIGSTIYLLHSKKYRKYVVIGAFIGVIYLISAGIGHFDEIMDTYFMFFDHSRGRETDISTGRFELWSQALKNMGVINWFFGLGIGSKDAIMSVRNISILGAELNSFHSGYVDLFFETGLLGIIIWGRTIIKTMKNVNKKCPAYLRNFFISILTVFLVSCIFDSCFMIYTTDTMAVFSTFFSISLPNTVANYYNKRNQELIR